MFRIDIHNLILRHLKFINTVNLPFRYLNIYASKKKDFDLIKHCCR